MKGLFLLLACLVLAAAAGPSLAADWREIDSNSAGVNYYDWESLVKKGSQRQIWIKTVYTPLWINEFIFKSYYEEIAYDIALYEVDCKKEQWKISKAMFYNSEDMPVGDAFEDEDKTYYMPNRAITDRILIKLCR